MPPEAAVAIVLADGAAPSRALLDQRWPGWDAGVEIVVAADGGARHGPALGLRVDRWVGDGDSTSAADLDALEAGGTVLRRVPAAKDETDTELAVLEAIRSGAGGLILLGGLGGSRVDHALANLGLLAHPALGARRVTMYDEEAARITVVSAVDGPAVHELRGAVGDVVSLLPFGGDAHGVRTVGLEYPLVDEPLLLGPARGISNVRIAPEATVRLQSGRLLVIETPARLPP